MVAVRRATLPVPTSAPQLHGDGSCSREARRAVAGRVWTEAGVVAGRLVQCLPVCRLDVATPHERRLGASTPGLLAHAPVCSLGQVDKELVEAEALDVGAREAGAQEVEDALGDGAVRVEILAKNHHKVRACRAALAGAGHLLHAHAPCHIVGRHQQALLQHRNRPLAQARLPVHLHLLGQLL